ncbi:hypothetical protein [Hydrogenophaga sp.]|uniref:hypothetical protein n=1 Tax=Hydrogenophaga sp. TaxID=1904254 RepID=UPI002FCB8F30
MEKRTFIELTISESDIVFADSPRRILVDVSHIATVEDMVSNPHGECVVTLHEPRDETIENDTGEHVVRCARKLMTLDTYDDICRRLSASAELSPSGVVTPRKFADDAIERVRGGRGLKPEDQPG